ncbi:capsular polysaccharide export protein, LipB/KpsS family [Rhizobium rhizophilum]|uniref:Nitrogen fixation protein FixF n=1 Tax=Rhizobium rhizophilum TaxID=1850373 RepID=A0ABY2QXM2_9HYPH|nr:nitrogen fixation protein FixF [Rhizobium rhizophilum]THV15710.1 nitrogen fixation protein FixF [Rhizobium rhizophilum]
MSDVEFICHTKQLGTLSRHSAGRILPIPTRLTYICSSLMKRRGMKGFLSALIGTNAVPDPGYLVDRNLMRRQIRLPQLFSITPVRNTYRFFLLSRARLQAALVAAYFEDHPQAKALVFNGYLMPDSIAKAVSETLRRETLVLENGFFPGTSQADTAGINFDSTLPRDHAFYEWVADKISDERPQELVKRPSKQKATNQVETPPRYMFVPMQVPSDMQILKHSPWISDMRHLYQVIYEQAERFPERHFVVKEHPSFPLSIQQQISRHPRILFANHNETRLLIEGAEAVLTVNSTVGLESLLLGKKVITLGNAPYNVEGMVLQCRNEQELHAALVAIESWTPNTTVINAFIRYVHNVFLLRGDVRKGDADILNALSSRANGIDEHSRLTAAYKTWILQR